MKWLPFKIKLSPIKGNQTNKNKSHKGGMIATCIPHVLLRLCVILLADSGSFCFGAVASG